MLWMLAWAGSAPIYVARASGAHLTDVDGNDYVDFCLGDTGAMTGHAPARAVEVIRERLADGLTFMLPTDDAIAVSDQLRRRFGLARWSFTLSASDANRNALRYARLVTGRPKILIFDRSYHGTVDECFATLEDGRVVQRPGSLGPPIAPSATTRVVQFNDVDALERELATGDVACVLTEPALTNIGIVLPEPGFHDALRDATRRAGALLAIDETHTISASPGGWTAAHELQPDLLVIGKPIGSGVPGAALGMTDEVASRLGERIDPGLAGMGGVGGTLAANALSLAAMRVTLDEVLTEDAYERMTGLGTRWADGVMGVIERHDLAWHVVQIGGRVEYHFSPRPLRNGAEGVAIVDQELSGYLHLHALNRGVMVFPFHNRGLMSPAHDVADIDRHGRVLDEAVTSLRDAAS
jgi:glutamate-1-semialdehyde 2,1-aminomutase